MHCRRRISDLVVMICLFLTATVAVGQRRSAPIRRPVAKPTATAVVQVAREKTYSEVESQLRPLATPLDKPRPGDWLHEHKEAGQTFAQYLLAKPVRRSAEHGKIYLCLLGDFSEAQTKVLDITREYLAIYFEAPVEIHSRVSLKEVPPRAARRHPQWGDPQILSTWVLNELLKPKVPADALAYLAFTSSDLWPGENWNFVYGQANLRDRTGVWSIYRNGDPAKEDEYQICLSRTLRTASHETGHILTMQHCTAFQCNMNGVNHQAEGDSKPLHLCPVCLRKLCWNLQVDPIGYANKMLGFNQTHGFDDEADWYAEAILALRGNK